MKFRMDKILRFWVECSYAEMKFENPDCTKDQLLVEILRDYERAGNAMRYLDASGRVSWKASPAMLQHLADAEREVEADLEDYP
jgi:hypothetical protein